MKDSADAELGRLVQRCEAVLALLDEARSALQATMASLQRPDPSDDGAAEESILGSGGAASGPDQTAEPTDDRPAGQDIDQP